MLTKRSAVNATDPSCFDAPRIGCGLARGHALVGVQQLAGVLAQMPAALLIEVGCGQLEQFVTAHIPGAVYLDTCEIELAPLFNKIDDDALLALLLRCGIHHGATVILYGRSTLAAARAAHLMLYAGVADVRLLDGGFAQWCSTGLPCTQGLGRRLTPVHEFGAPFPLCPHFMTSFEQARTSTNALVSVRTWSEFSGASSGYSYIAARGEISGARWGRAGREGDVNSMSEYQHADGCMQSAASIERMWSGAGIVRGQQAIFYCGTGWRASLAFLYAWLMGWDAISVYDGGWFEWSLDRANPIIVRIDSAIAA